MTSHLHGLNEAQSRAVQHSPDIPLQILAGPGSGKTRVLTSRIVHLISEHGIPPSAICAVTFTNKAANEMRERLTKMVGKEVVNSLKMGTFHSLCARFVRKYAKLAGIEGNFTVCDSEESKKIITKLLKPYKKRLSARDILLTESTVQSRISKAKAKGLTPKDLSEQCLGAGSRSKGSLGTVDTDSEGEEEFDEELDATDAKEVPDTMVARIYGRYQRVLHKNNSLDFDDLLIYGVRLFKENKKVGEWCQHILVDEFQDTNVMQYNLMKYIASSSRRLTVVGDPDQSIYGWRSAEVENLANMRRDFADTEQIFLEQNYRSTGSILAVSIAVIQQDKKRIQKTLHTTHPKGPKPTLCKFDSAEAESAGVATEIKRIIASTGGMLGYNDFVILLRYNALSRVLESALQKEGIPSRILGGHRFFERIEVKDLLAYLQLIDNPQFVPAFTRVINVPGRNIGEKSVAEILSKASRLGITPLDVVERIHDGKIPDIKPPLKRKIVRFVHTTKTLRKLAKEEEAPASLLRRLLELIQYEQYLKKTQQDWESRWENVQELISFASELERDLPTFIENARVPEGDEKDDWGDVVEDEYDEEELDDLGFSEMKPPTTNETSNAAITPLRAFLQMTMLSTDTETEENDEQQKKDRVTISTCHAAKGLEWPVVFVPAVESGIFPASRAEDLEEERRLLYVACTRAQCLLYLTHAGSRRKDGEVMKNGLSEFLQPILRSSDTTLSGTQPEINPVVLNLFATVTGRAVPEQAEVDTRLAQLKKAGKLAVWPPPSKYEDMTYKSTENRDNGPSTASRSHPTEAHPPATVQFVSAKSAVFGDQPFRSNIISKPTPLSPSRRIPNAASHPKNVSKPNASSSQKPSEPKIGSKQDLQPSLKGHGSITTWLRPSSGSLTKPIIIDEGVEPHLPSRETSSAAKKHLQSSAHPPAIPVASSTSRLHNTPVAPEPTNPSTGIRSTAANLGGGKRRLGMSRAVTGYPNKKFKPPT
ncbi:UvrD-helicase-domain-containing protein [Trametopsis cervina]|nr:UvrD-helicase-domain-containing protein [Trametopsis cervina]